MNTYEERLDGLQSALEEAGLDGCLLIPGASLYYYTGIQTFVDLLTTVMFIPATGHEIGEAVLLVPDFEKETLEAQLPFSAKLIPYERNATGYAAGFDQWLERCALESGRVGVESTVFRHREIAELGRTAPALTLESCDKILMGFRTHKAADEIECIRRAAQLTEIALDAMIEHIKPGVTEVQLRNRFQIEALEAGADGLGFDSLVVSGPRAALQHAAPSERALEHGDVVLFDVGARHLGYTADITRTFAVREASAELRSIYDVVREANQAAFEAAGPGVPASIVDAAAREVIEKAGYGETFIHGTGHGLGLDVHEPPRVAPGSDAVLSEGMVFTIEPGIYLSGRLGVRIEDDVVVTSSGAERLTSFDHDLTVV